MNLLDIVLYFGVAAIAGAINSVAGGGTFLTFPVLILNGMSSIQANIVSTVALWPGSLAGAHAYRKERNIDLARLIKFIIISVLGSAIGTAILLMTPETTFDHLVPWLLLIAVLIFTFGNSLPTRGRVMVGALVTRSEQKCRPSAFAKASSDTPILTPNGGGVFLLQFMIAVYGGYFGAGIGILMLAMLQLIGLAQIHQMNAIKTVLGSTINAVAVFVFIFSGRVVWDVAFVMIIGAIVGGYFGARLSLTVSEKKIRLLVSIIGFAMSAYFFLYGV